MTIKAGVPANLEAFYKDGKNWPDRPQPRDVQVYLDYNGKQIRLHALTNALSGRDDHVYSCWVRIGETS